MKAALTSTQIYLNGCIKAHFLVKVLEFRLPEHFKLIFCFSRAYAKG